MRHPGNQAEREPAPCRLSKFLRSRLAAVGLAIFAGVAPQAATARGLPDAGGAADPPPAMTQAADAAGGAQAAAAQPSAATAAGESAAAPAAGSSAPAANGSAATPADAAPAAASARDDADGVSAGTSVWKLFVIDARSVFTAPAHWTGRDWALFSAEVAGIAALTQADKHLRFEVLRGNSSFETNLAEGFRPFGSYAAFGVLGAFYVGGLLGHDSKAQETALDGTIASAIAAGVITPALKEIVGRSRPSTHKGVYDFHPFSGNASFPSGESTVAFAAGSVIAAEYPNTWVEILSYGTASLVAFARMREDAHWASDVLTGALIGTGVGRLVVRTNRHLRAKLTVAPLIAPGARGLTFMTAF